MDESGNERAVIYDNNASVFFALSVLKYVFDTIGEEVEFLPELQRLLSEYPKVNLAAMGFVFDWEKQTLWSDVWVSYIRIQHIKKVVLNG